MLELSLVGIKYPRNGIYVPPFGTITNAAAHNEIQFTFRFRQSGQSGEVVWAPNIVVAEICNPRSSRFPDPEIVWKTLTSGVLLQIVPTYRVRPERANNILRCVGAAAVQNQSMSGGELTRSSA